MFSITFKINVPSSREKNMLQQGIACIQEIRRLEGCTGFKMFRDIENREVFYLLSEWKTVKIAAKYFKGGLFNKLHKTLNILIFPVEVSYQFVTKQISDKTDPKCSEDSNRPSHAITDLAFPDDLVRGFTEHTANGSQTKYASSKISEEQIQAYLHQVIDHMDANKPYLEKNLTLTKFAKDISIHPHHVSRVINEKLEMNFSNFINSYRVEYSKQFLIEDFLSKYTISGIGTEVGFNSRSAFYNSFIKFAGMSPGEYAARNKMIAATARVAVPEN